MAQEQKTGGDYTITFLGNDVPIKSANEVQIRIAIRDAESMAKASEILMHALPFMWGSILSQLQWKVEQFQALVDASPADKREQVKQAFPLAIKTKISIDAIPAAPATSKTSNEGFHLEELFAGIGLGAAVGAVEFKSLLSGEEVTYRAPMSALDFLDPLKAKLKGFIQNVLVQASGSIITVSSGKEELCTIQVQPEGDDTTVYVEGLKVGKALNQGMDALTETAELAAQAASAIDLLKHGGAHALESLIDAATQTIHEGEEAVAAIGKVTGTVSLPKRVAGIVNGVAAGKVRMAERKRAVDRKDIFDLKEEIEHGTQCSSCGTPRNAESSCPNCGSPYVGLKLTPEQVEQKKAGIKLLSA